MGAFTTNHEECLEKIAQVMSEKTQCTVTVDDVRLEVSRVTTSIYSAVVPDNAGGVSNGNKCIICTVSKWKKPYAYLVTAS